MKAIAVALILALFGAECALAADLPVPGSAPIPPNSYYPISPPPVNWGGVYIGLNGGYGLGKSNWSDSLGSTGNFAANGGVFGGTLGINYAGFGDWVLLGFEGDFDWSGATGSGGCSVLGPDVLLAGATCQTRIDWLSTFRLRAGYTWSHFLFYATAGGAVGRVSFEWAPAMNFIVATRTVEHRDATLENGTQWIGWDPAAKQIRSWSFEADGGFGEGTWSKNGNKWIIKTSSSLANGSKVTTTNVVTRVDADTITWKSTDQKMDGNALPDSAEITMKRTDDRHSTDY